MRRMEERLERIEADGRALRESLQGLPAHIRAMCDFTDALRRVMRPVYWCARNIRRLVLWFGGLAGGAYAVWLLWDRVQNGTPWT